jgi:thiol-disulfide isomerase/thioredoxin
MDAYNFLHQMANQPGQRRPPCSGTKFRQVELLHERFDALRELSDLRGKVVCLELWSTGCGPCQPAIGKLNQLAAEKRDTWRGRVVLVPLSIDERPEDVARHVKRLAWDQLDHYWSGEEGSRGWNAPAIQAFGIEAVPRMLLINRNGRIVWRGHPADQSYAARIEELLK